MTFLYLIIGLIGLAISSHYVVRGAQSIAKFFKISELFIGLTIISIGTSLPEVAINMASGFNKLKGIDASGIAVGNAIGSSLNLFTIILGTIIMFGAIKVSKANLKRDGAALIISVVVIFLMALDLEITRLEGAILIILYIFYLFSLRTEGKLFKKLFNNGNNKSKGHLLWDIVLILGGLVLVVYSSKTVVDSGIEIAKIFNIENTLVGILIIGLGTGLPELTISLTASLKKSYHLAVGNLLGSNICDLLFSLGAGAVIAGFNIDKSLLMFEFPFLLFTFIITITFFKSKGRLDRKEGAVLILLYLIYLGIKLKFNI